MDEREKELELDDELEDGAYDTIALVDEDGKQQEFEIVDCCELDDHQYMALTPVLDDPDEFLAADGQLVILRVAEDSEEEGDQYLESVTDEEEYDRVVALFRERLAEDYNFLDDED